MKTKIGLFLLFTTLSIIPKTGDKAPDSFMILDYKQGKPVFFDTLIKDQNVLLNFWATYCVPCKKKFQKS